MAAPDPLAGTPEEFRPQDWREAVGSFHPAGGDHFTGDGGGDAALVGVIADDRVRGFHRYALGYAVSVSEGNQPFALRRTHPLRHPRWRELAATATGAVAYAPKGRGLRRAVSAMGQTALPAFASYKLAKATIQFGPVAYSYADDQDLPPYTIPDDTGQYSGVTIPAEWLRYTVYDLAPKVDYLEIENCRLIFSEGDVQKPKGRFFQSPTVQILAKPDLTVTTYRLPGDFLFRGNSGQPDNVLRGLGKVSKRDWSGYAAGTLLFLGAKMTRKRWALREGAESPWLWEVSYMFSVFDPPKGIYNGTIIPTNRGHNNMPWQGDRDPTTGLPVVGDVNTGRWFFATRTGSPDGLPLLERFDMAQLWSDVRNPVEP